MKSSYTLARDLAGKTAVVRIEPHRKPHKDSIFACQLASGVLTYLCLAEMEFIDG